MNNVIKILSIRRGESPCLTHINNDLESLQKFVGGYIEAVPLTDNILLICNEEGKIKGLKPSCMIWRGKINDIIAGDCFLCGSDGEEFADYPEGAEISVEKMTHIELPAVKIGG